MNRRHFLGGSLALLSMPAAAAEGQCAVPGHTISAVTGPFPPTAFHAQAGGRPNPGARLAVAENDMDLSIVKGAAAAALGQVVMIHGKLLAGDCIPIAGAAVQLWQADANGQYNHENEKRAVRPQDLDPGFGYWGSTTTDASGEFTLRTIVPGSYAASSNWIRPPHLHWTVGADGFAPITTQSYFEGDLLTDIAKIRALHEADHILNMNSGFESRLRGVSLDAARRRVRNELVTTFTAGCDGIPTGNLIMRLDA